MHLLGIPGSNRPDSYNLMLLNALHDLLPKSLTLEICSLNELPIVTSHESREITPPVKKFREQIHHADAIVFSTPEYNFSYPEILKNAIGWAVKAEGKNVFTGKSAALIGASMDSYGTQKALNHLQEDLSSYGMQVIASPVVSVTDVASKFDATGHLTDEKISTQLKKLLTSLAGK